MKAFVTKTEKNKRLKKCLQAVFMSITVFRLLMNGMSLNQVGYLADIQNRKNFRKKLQPFVLFKIQLPYKI